MIKIHQKNYDQALEALNKAEKMNPNRRAEKRRVISELNRGYKKY